MLEKYPKAICLLNENVNPAVSTRYKRKWSLAFCDQIKMLVVNSIRIIPVFKISKMYEIKVSNTIKLTDSNK